MTTPEPETIEAVVDTNGAVVDSEYTVWERISLRFETLPFIVRLTLFFSFLGPLVFIALFLAAYLWFLDPMSIIYVVGSWVAGCLFYTVYKLLS